MITYLVGHDHVLHDLVRGVGLHARDAGHFQLVFDVQEFLLMDVERTTKRISTGMDTTERMNSDLLEPLQGSVHVAVNESRVDLQRCLDVRIRRLDGGPVHIGSGVVEEN